ncbi:glutathione S-transferase family protein [Pseudomaricurvus sp. HS19]|uniref:glutathione S-transferase family protein n=1 Tax=Pseudomaricurvus sp. HS19 TaxID=2692626 RepID=UPI0013696996|nr:glutathione S-transferase family protein [Pseudomaricurvus sp. HS19]MYM64057.1 glutathione S-transferase [Pseudomaricurvus sp. HS19]
MKLIGVNNSPYHRRTAISLTLLGVPFEVQTLSPFMHSEALSQINPMMKVPTLVCDSGEQIMDSSLIIQYAESTLTDGKSLWSADTAIRQREYRAASLALAALEKCLQIVYETRLRPADVRHLPWLQRLETQLQAGLGELDRLVDSQPEVVASEYSQATITAAIAGGFARTTVPASISDLKTPALAALSARMEATPVFQQFAP